MQSKNRVGKSRVDINGEMINYSLTISNHCLNTKRELSAQKKENRLIEGLTKLRLDSIIKPFYYKTFKKLGKYLFIIEEKYNQKKKNYFLVVFEADKHINGNIFIELITTVSSENEYVTFKKIPVENRIVITDKTYEEVLKDTKLMTTEEAFQEKRKLIKTSNNEEIKKNRELHKKQRSGLKIKRKNPKINFMNLDEITSLNKENVDYLINQFKNSSFDEEHSKKILGLFKKFVN